MTVVAKGPELVAARPIVWTEAYIAVWSYSVKESERQLKVG